MTPSCPSLQRLQALLSTTSQCQPYGHLHSHPVHPRPPKAAPILFCHLAEVVAPELIGCLLVRRQPSGELLWGVLVETEAYSQEEPACHGCRRRSPSNEMLFGEPGRFYVYVSYGIHHCMNRVHQPGAAEAKSAQ
jgi:DNA-3-methyladenine glycosylase